MAIYFFNKNQTLIKIVPESATFEAMQTQELDDDSLLKDTLSVTVKGDEKLLDAEYMAVKSYTGNPQTFDMYRIITDTTPDKTMSFTGMSLAPYELNGYIIQDLRPTNRSLELTLNNILNDTDWRLGYIDSNLSNVTTTFYYVSAKEALKELQSLTGCEFVFKVEISGQKITDKWIEVYKEMGNRTKKRFNYGTNALTVVRETNKTDIYTALIGRGKGEEVSSADDNTSGQAGYGRKITFEDIEWSTTKGNPLDKPKGQYYLELPQATQVYGIKNIDGTMSARVGVVDFDDETDKNRLINLTYQQLLVSSRPKVLFKTTVANIGATGIGDTVTIHRHDLGIHYQTRVRKIVRNKLNDNKTQIELGDAVVTASTKRAKENNATIKNLTQELEKVKDDVTTSQTSADGKNTIFYGSKEPERQRTGDTWYRPHPSIAGETQMLVWNGTAWELVVDSSDLTSVAKEVEAAAKVADEAVQSANDAVEQIDTAVANAGFTSLDETINSVQSISNTAKTNAQTALNQSLDALENASTALANSQTSLERADTAISSASSALTKADDAKNVATVLSGQVSDFEITVGGFNQTVNNYEGQVSGFRNDISGLNSTIANYTTEVDEFGKTVSTYATEVSTMRNTVSGFESTVAEYETELLGYRGDVTRYKNQVSTMTNTVNGFNNTVAQYTTEVGEYGKEVNSYATKVSTLENTVNGFNSTVSDIQYDLDNLEIGGRNLVIKSDAFISSSGYKSFDFVNDLKDLRNKTITLSVYVEIDNIQYTGTGNRRIGFEASIRFKDGSIKYLGVWYYPSEGESFRGRISVKHSIPDKEIESTGQDSIYIQNITGDVIRVGRPKIEIGTKATDWTPAPEDMATVTQVSTLSNTVNGFQSKVDKVEQDYNDVSETVATHSTSISNLNGQIALKANTTTVNALAGRVGTAETAITSNANAIKLKASQSSVDTLSGAVNTIGSQVDVTAGKISNKVWMSDIDDIEVGATNLLLNSDKIKSNSGSIDGIPFSLSNSDWNNLQGKEITFSVHITKTNVDSTISQERIGAEFSILYDDGQRDYVGAWHTKNDPKTYSGRISKVYRIRNRRITKVSSVALHIQVGGSNLSVSKPKVEIGNKASDWSPAPEDTIAHFDSIETEWTQTFDTFSQIVSDIDGRVTTQKQTIDSISSTVSDHGGRLSTVEQTANGLKATVADKANQSQVTQLANGLSSVVKDLENGGRNLLMGTSSEQQYVSSNNEYGMRYWLVEKLEPNTEYVLRFRAKNNTGINSGRYDKLRVSLSMGADGIQAHTILGNFYDLDHWKSWTDDQDPYEIKFTTPLSVDNVVVVWFINRRSTFPDNVGTLYLKDVKLEKGNKATPWSLAEEDKASQSQISQLSDNINLRVEKGDLLSQINVQAGSVLITSGTNKLNVTPTTTYIENGTIKSAMIESLEAGKIKTGTLDAGKVKVINIDAENITSNKTSFVQSAWNAINSRLSVTGSELKYTHSDGSYTRLNANGIQTVVGGSAYQHNYLTHVSNVTINSGSAGNVQWVQLPSVFKGKDFTYFMGATDIYGAVTEPDYFNNKMMLKRFVLIKHPDYNIDYANARIPILGYAHYANIDTRKDYFRALQGIVFAQY